MICASSCLKMISLDLILSEKIHVISSDGLRFSMERFTLNSKERQKNKHMECTCA